MAQCQSLSRLEYRMTDAILQGNPPIPLTLRRSARARRLTLRVSRTDGRVTLTMPRGVPEAEAVDFARLRENWIRKHLDTRPEVVDVTIGAAIPVLGEMRHVVAGQGRKVVLRDAELAVPGAPEQVGRKAQAWLKQLARSELAYASDQYAAKLGRSYGRITLRDTRSRWGSCTSDGGLMYSWRLIMAPAEVLAYVAAHEVAHLAEMNHSPAFWEVVEKLYGDHAPPRRWLRTEGHGLHAIRFHQ